ncbi:helicase-associated domain-containing protein [Aneurinibacillus sp. Ricciae_BoGa-3]|uniref:DNA repair helicase XPB n=1 Tax=Aneurinibacillus sp. Ricciae_BoGa-3 TaxID=3022697 RepID=UPI00234170A3|nr:DNA repair helicase XPB [Aneurinibacillus sp. Ricciae_BoGa-3]WCK56042.1 helicase-associated domain-containing protein [Aneurinibacillus sp. Ricciae_BoGa-3]
MMMNRPLIVQGDRTLLLEVNHELYKQTRSAILPFAELVKSPDYIHTYRITPLSLWNAASLGMQDEQIIETLERYSKYPIPRMLVQEIKDTVSRFGKIMMRFENNDLLLVSEDDGSMEELLSYPSFARHILRVVNPYTVAVPKQLRGLIKQSLLKLGYPVRDLSGYSSGEPLDVTLNNEEGFTPRSYQIEAVDAFYAGGSVYGGNGVVVLPCGAGKTIVGIETMARIKMDTLILTSNTTSVHQWRAEILKWTTLSPDQVGIYTGSEKEVCPVTISTYQMMTYKNASGEFPHLDLFHRRNWGLILYDEVHLLPAPVFRMTADIQAKRRLGLTATLVREDGREEDVFSLIGPKKYELPWRILEEEGYIARASCTEIRLPLVGQERSRYMEAGERQKFRIASENSRKIPAVKNLLQRHAGEQVLIIGQYVSQMEELSHELGIPLITGRTPNAERETLYTQFRRGEISNLIVSRVANFAVDLPDASVAVQISGMFGSRQEEAQRLGRILRPKKTNQAYFYTLVSAGSTEETYALKRQMFLIEQGYSYKVVYEE